MVTPFLATLNIALRASRLPAGGTAYLALTVRSADLLNSFLLALGPSLRLWGYKQTYGSNPQRTTTCQLKNCHTSIVTVASYLWNSPKVSIKKSECLKSISFYNTTRSSHYPHCQIN